ncbi:hypothetical protein OAU50_07785 [Planctomycetota bacterium]|nr:hypothetical protein [Planctomycetota bacterium]
MERVVRVVLDVNTALEAARLFNPDTVPMCLVLDAEGNEQGRFVGFAAAKEHADWLSSFVDE